MCESSSARAGTPLAAAASSTMLNQYLKHLILHTPLHACVDPLLRLASLPRRWRHPELREIVDEPLLMAAACRLLLTPSSNTIDVGAHLGSQLAQFVDLAREGSHVAFEPVPHKARWLQRKFPHVDVRQTGLSHARSQSAFFVNESRPGYSGLRAQANTQDVVVPITVELTTLDDAIDPARVVDLIKVDVEGAELFVLQGATRILTRDRPSLLFESTQTGLELWGLKPEQLFDFLNRHGYRVYLPRTFVAGGVPLTREEFAEAHTYPFLAFNFIATAPERVFGRRLVSARGQRAERMRVAAKVNMA
jgi:FkbM family methyltransferase